MKKEKEWKGRLEILLKGTDWALWYGDEWDLSDEIIEIVEQEKQKSYEEGRRSVLSEFRKYKKEYIENIWEYYIPDDLIEDTLENVDEFLSELINGKK